MLNMARCISPFRKVGETMDLPCGKCFACRARRVSGWSFRLMKEAERSNSALFVTLTYNSVSVPVTLNHMMTLRKRHVQLFMKKLRKANNQKLKYYVCGEYGTKSMRPHYHMILFNAKPETIMPAWGLGEIHIGDVNGASVGYTLKYMCKPGRVPVHQNDQRKPEFAMMSKGLGSNYLTPEMIHWHKADLLHRLYANLTDGKKISLPRYYRKKIYSDHQVLRIINEFKRVEMLPENLKKENLENRKKWDNLLAQYKRHEKDTRTTQL